VVLAVVGVMHKAAALALLVKVMLEVLGHLIRAVGVKLLVEVEVLLLWVALEQTLLQHQHQKAAMVVQEPLG
jgi:hypothetical protein